MINDHRCQIDGKANTFGTHGTTGRHRNLHVLLRVRSQYLDGLHRRYASTELFTLPIIGIRMCTTVCTIVPFLHTRTHTHPPTWQYRPKHICIYRMCNVVSCTEHSRAPATLRSVRMRLYETTTSVLGSGFLVSGWVTAHVHGYIIAIAMAHSTRDKSSFRTQLLNGIAQ